jgi:hypothetical protein
VSLSCNKNKQGWQLSFIAELSMKLCHISGQSNVVAYELSRPPMSVGQWANYLPLGSLQAGLIA